MQGRTRKLKTLKKRIMKTRRRGKGSRALSRDVAEFYRKRRDQGVTLEGITDELDVTTWQLADWLGHAASGNRGRRHRRKSKIPMFEVKVPATPRFEKLLAREAARALQKCDSCCWKKLVDSLPSEFLNSKEDSES